MKKNTDKSLPHRYLFERLLRKKEGKPDIGDAVPNSVEGKSDGSTEDSGVGNNKENGGLALQPQKPEVHVFFGVFPPDNADVSSDPGQYNCWVFFLWGVCTWWAILQRQKGSMI